MLIYKNGKRTTEGMLGRSLKHVYKYMVVNDCKITFYCWNMDVWDMIFANSHDAMLGYEFLQKRRCLKDFKPYGVYRVHPNAVIDGTGERYLVFPTLELAINGRSITHVRKWGSKTLNVHVTGETYGSIIVEFSDKLTRDIAYEDMVNQWTNT